MTRPTAQVKKALDAMKLCEDEGREVTSITFNAKRFKLHVRDVEDMPRLGVFYLESVAATVGCEGVAFVEGAFWFLLKPKDFSGFRRERNAGPELRAEIHERDGKCCAYCGATEGKFHIDHIVPVSRDGTNDPSNLTVACAPCNLAKGDKLLSEWKGRTI